jgi:hypothetical protein
MIDFRFSFKHNFTFGGTDMKINKKIISIPPHISTTWANISSIHMKDEILVITLMDRKIIEIPNLNPEDVEIIFSSHAAALEENSQPSVEKMMRLPTENPFRVGFSTLDNFGMPMQHDPNQSEAPDLPQEVLEKIAAIAQVLSPEDGLIAPQSVENCNCVYCQISRTLNGLDKIEIDITPLSEQEDIKPEDISFQQWEIIQTGEKLYTVTSRLDSFEKYNVYLGHPVGCTCGLQGCEHILAVLKS